MKENKNKTENIIDKTDNLNNAIFKINQLSDEDRERLFAEFGLVKKSKIKPVDQRKVNNK